MLILKRIWKISWNACVTFVRTDGELRAASFSYYAFFSLFPLVILLVTVGSVFLPPEIPGRMVEAVKAYLSLDPADEAIFRNTIDGVIASRGKVSILAVAGLAWGAMRLFQALVVGINRAWGRRDYCWVSLSLTNLAMMGILASALFIGAVVPMILDAIGSRRFSNSWVSWAYEAGRALVPSVVLFYGFLMLYRLAPRHKTKFSQVWIPALVATILIQVVQRMFVFYAYKLANFNAVYGALGSMTIILMWVYITGMIIIFGGCLCASGAKIPRSRRKQPAQSANPAPPAPTDVEQQTLF